MDEQEHKELLIKAGRKAGLSQQAAEQHAARVVADLHKSADYTAMPPAELLQALGMDALKWADAFVQFNPTIDRDRMIGWFANAIMAGYDAGRKAPTDQAL